VAGLSLTARGGWRILQGEIAKGSSIPETGQASARTDALVSQPETGKISCVRHPYYGRLSPGML
jgi:hypothetical protein